MNFQVRYSVPLLLCAAFLLSACGSDSGSSASTSAPQPESLGLMKITVSGLGTNTPSSTAELISAPAGGAAHERTVTTAPLGVDVKQVSATSIDVGTRGAGGMRYFNVIYSVRNAQFCATPGSCAPYAVASPEPDPARRPHQFQHRRHRRLRPQALRRYRRYRRTSP